MKKQKSKGFTLIELLVVVLIIGILATVAVPQYQKAVEKSHAMEAITLLKAIAQSQQMYYMTHGKYATQFSQLEDIRLPSSFSGKIAYFDYGKKDARSNDKWSIQLYDAESSHAVRIGRLTGRYKGGAFVVFLQVPTSSAFRNYEGKIICQEVKSLTPTYVFKLSAGSFCQKLFGGTLFSDAPGGRSYAISV